jgi:hypothetical protein
MKKCPRCKNWNNAEANFCQSCGLSFGMPPPVSGARSSSWLSTTSIILLATFLLSSAVIYLVLRRDRRAEPPAAVSATPVYTPLTRRPPMAHASPSIGMSFADFQLTCPGNPEDISSFESARGTTYTYRLPYNERNAQKSCYGTFTFEEDELTFISR